MPLPKILISIGTRPEAIKLAPVVLELGRAPWCEARVLARHSIAACSIRCWGSSAWEPTSIST